MQVVRKSRKVVNNMQTLRAMARSGHIVLHSDTGKKLGGCRSASYYIQGGECSKFTFRGKQFLIEYFDGCFCPYVVTLVQK